MHCIELAELAAHLAYRTPIAFVLRASIAETPLTQYWIQSRQRLEHWHRGLSEYSLLESAGRPLAMQAWWNDYEPMLEEIVVTDVLTRIFAALGMGIDTVTDQREVEPITHSVFLSHLEARNRVLQLLLFGRGGSVDQSMRLNRLRRACERWTDRLLAPITVLNHKATAYAFDGQRSLAYAQEWREEPSDESKRMAAWLGQAALQATLHSRTSSRVFLPESNRAVVHAVIACLPHEYFDSYGLLKSPTLAKLTAPPQGDRQPNFRQPLFPPSMPKDHRKGTTPQTVRWMM
jgi:hypothetical protein